MFPILLHHLKLKGFSKEASSKVVVTICSIGEALMRHMNLQFEHKIYRAQLISMTSKTLDENTLLQASRNLYHPYRPIIDGKIITDNLAKKYIEGSINDVDLMIGSNKNEDLLYVEENPTLDSFTKRIAEYYPEQVDEILGHIGYIRSASGNGSLWFKSANNMSFCPDCSIHGKNRQSCVSILLHSRKRRK